MKWHVYIILCSDNTLYTGITTDMGRRLSQHAQGSGAKYFRGRQPVHVVFLESGHSRSTAGRREAEIKRMKHADKHLLISSVSDGIAAGAAPGSSFSYFRRQL